MMSRGISSPSWVRRKPVSIACAASVLISMISPRFACAGTLTMARAILDQAFFETGRERHHHLRAVGPERAVGELGDCDHGLRVGKAHARRYTRTSRARSEMDAHHVRQRVLLGEDVDRLD